MRIRRYARHPDISGSPVGENDNLMMPLRHVVEIRSMHLFWRKGRYDQSSWILRCSAWMDCAPFRVFFSIGYGCKIYYSLRFSVEVSHGYASNLEWHLWIWQTTCHSHNLLVWSTQTEFILLTKRCDKENILDFPTNKNINIYEEFKQRRAIPKS